MPSLPPEHDHSIDLLIRSDESMRQNNHKQKRHSSVVRLMRLVFPVLALSVVVVLMTWKSDRAPVAPIPREKVSPQTVARNELIKPKFQSEDSAQNPYTITADKAVQNATDMDAVVLDKPVAGITLQSGEKVSVTAAQGVFHQAKKTLALDGSIEVTHDGGYALSTTHMDIDVASKTITSDKPVTATGKNARIESAGLSVEGNSKIVTFTGPTKLVIENKKGQSHE